MIAALRCTLGDPCTIWDVTTLRELSEFPCPTPGMFGADVSFNADGSRIVIARDGSGKASPASHRARVGPAQNCLVDVLGDEGPRSTVAEALGNPNSLRTITCSGSGVTCDLTVR
jgi:hypothetical protein